MIEIALVAVFISISIFVFLIGKRLIPAKKKQIDGIRLIKKPVFGPATAPLAGVVPVSKAKIKLLRSELLAAGKFHKTATINFLAIRNAGLLSMLLMLGFLFAAGVFDGFEWIALAVGGVFSAIIIAVPMIVLSGKAKKRKQKIEKSVPDVLDLISMAVAGGIPVSMALARIHDEVRDSYPELSQELAIICRQSKTGSIEFAFEQFAERIQIPEIVAWSSLMKQNHRLGGTIVTALSEYASRIREDRVNRIESSGNSASIKLLLPVVTCICPPIAIMLIGPALLDLRDFIKREADSPSAAISQFNEIRDQASTIVTDSPSR